MNQQVASPQAPAAPAHAGYIIVAQVKCDRILYFTDDPDFVPVMDADWYFVSHHLGALPEGMTLANCWEWRFRGSVFIDERHPRPKGGPQRLIDYNRDALLKLLREKINDARAPLLAQGSMGEHLRTQKLAQARHYQAGANAGAEPPADLALLGAIARARNITLADAAQLVIGRAEQTERMLLDTEIVREEMRMAIRAAKTEEALLLLRQELMNDVYPALSAKYKFAVANTTPIDQGRVLEPVQRVHETARLKAQLREHVNAARAKLHDGYQLGDWLAMRRLELARAYLRDGALPADEHAAALLDTVASGYGLPVAEAAARVVAEAAAAEKLLFDTERDKLAMLARIDKINTLKDIRTVAAAIRRLGLDHPAGGDGA